MDIPQSRIFIGRTDIETEAPVFCSADANRWLIGKIPHAGKDWGQKEKRASEDEMTRQHHWCSEQKLGQTWGDGEGQGVLVCCSPRGHKESDMTGWQNNYHCVPSSVGRLLCCLHIFSIMNSAAISIHVKVLNIFVSWKYKWNCWLRG